MKGFQFNTHAASCLLLVLSSTMICTGLVIDGVEVSPGIMNNEGGTTVPADLVTMNATCQQYPNSGFIGNPSNCSSYGYCSGNVLVSVGSCGVQFRYDIQSGTCVYPDKVDCINSAAATCQYKTSPTYVVESNSCSEYVWCDGAGESKSGFKCPSTQYFDETTQACTYANTCSSNNICRLVQDGVFLGDPKKCGSWIQCINGKVDNSGSCATGKYFDKVTGTCGSTNVCGTYPTDAVKCTGVTETKYVSDGETCYGYYYCTSDSGPGTWGKCPFGTHFDGDTQECVNPVSTKCALNRCGNLDLQFVANPLCETYSLCKNQQTVGTPIACPTGKLFDEINQNCATSSNTDVEAYPICVAS